MKITYIGHACFLCESEGGLRVLLDPYRPQAFNGRISLRPFTERVDILVSTHNHADHFHLDRSFGRPAIVRGTGTVMGVHFYGMEVPHGGEVGQQGEMVTTIKFALDGVSVWHPGDIGQVLSDEEVRALGRVDVALLPVGGTFTIGPSEAIEIIRLLKPAIAIPMHYRMERVVDLRLQPLEDFLALVGEWERVEGPCLELKSETLPPPTKVLVMEPTHAR